MPDAPLVSVLVLSWNRREALSETLRHLERESYSPLEVIVVDNASTDGTVAMIQQEFPRVRLLPLDENVGVEGLNVGIRASDGSIIVLLDDDSYPVAGSIPAIVQAFEQDPRLGIAACRVLGPPEWNATWPWRNLNSGAEVDTFVGCGAGLRRTALGAAGLFDGSFFLYANELDLALRFMHAGYAVRYFPEITFVHAVSAVNRTNLRFEYYGTRNILMIMRKYLPLQEAIALGTRTVVGRLAHRLSRGNIRAAWAALRGTWDALVIRPAKNSQMILLPEVRQRLRAYIDYWYAPPWKIAVPRRPQSRGNV